MIQEDDDDDEFWNTIENRLLNDPHITITHTTHNNKTHQTPQKGTPSPQYDIASKSTCIKKDKKVEIKDINIPPFSQSRNNYLI